MSWESIQLTLFLYSLIGESTLWLDKFPNGSITTWNGLRTHFFDKFSYSTKCYNRKMRYITSNNVFNETIRDLVEDQE